MTCVDLGIVFEVEQRCWGPRNFESEMLKLVVYIIQYSKYKTIVLAVIVFEAFDLEVMMVV